MANNHKGILCGTRPVAHDGEAAEKLRCRQCHNGIEQEKAQRKGNGQKVIRFMTYRGIVIAQIEGPRPVNWGKTKRCRRWERVYKDPAKLPKRRTMDLNAYCQGYQREQIKRLKAMVLRLGS